MPNKEVEGVLVGFYAEVSGTPTLVAAKRGFDLEESSDAIDVSHADNRRAPIEVTAIGTGDVTVRGDRRRELNAHPEFTLQGTPSDDGTYTATSTALSGSDTVITVSATLSGGSVGTGRALIVAPYGFIERVPGQQDWNASFDGVLLLDDATGSFEGSHDALRDAKRNQDTILTQVRYPNTDGSNPRDEAAALVTSITLTAPYDGAATISMDLEGAEPLVYST